jgi:hypothetical protein
MADTASLFQGVGTLASAWGQYESDKKRTKAMEEQLDYEKKKDKLALAKADEAQINLDDAFTSSDLNKKKKIDPITGLELDAVA